MEGLREVRHPGLTNGGAALAALLALACGTSNDPAPPRPTFQLEGSLYEIMGIGYDEAALEEAPGSIAVRFVRNLVDARDGGAVQENTVFKVGYLFPEGEVAQPGVSLDLTQDAGMGVQRGLLSRAVFNDPRTAFPDAQRGTLTFDRLPDAGRATVTGRFNVTFVNGREPASGRTVFGNFEAKVP